MRKITFETMPWALEQLLEKLEQMDEKLSNPQLSAEPQIKKNLTSPEARAYLKQEYGYDISAFTLNKKCSQKEIPYKLRGRSRVFSPTILSEWVKNGCPKLNEINAAKRVAEQF